MLILQELYRVNPDPSWKGPDPLFHKHFGFFRKFITPHDLPAEHLGKMMVAQHCWGSRERALSPSPCPGWPDNDSYPWDDAEEMRGAMGPGRRGRVTWSQMEQGIPREPCLMTVYHHVWELRDEATAIEYWSTAMQSRTEAHCAAACTPLVGAEAVAAAADVAECDDSLILGYSHVLPVLSLHNRNCMFRVGRTCCKLYLGAIVPDRPDAAAAAVALFRPVISRAVQRLRVAHARECAGAAA
jgi:hypothetical protein